MLVSILSQRLAPILLFVFSATGLVASAAEVTLIENLPYRIEKPGRYKIGKDLEYSATTGAAVRIDADDVSLDFAGNTISGTAGDGTSAIGISAMDRKNLKIMGGTVRGFYFGIDIRASSRDEPKSSGHVVSRMRLDQNRYFGIRLEGTASKIEQCRITSTGGSTKPGHTIPHGVRLVGAKNVLRDCCIRDMILKRFADGKGEIVAVHFDAAQGSVMENNLIVELSQATDSVIDAQDRKERRFGVWVNGGPRKDTFLRASGNRFYGFTVPFAFTPGTDGRVSGNAFEGASPQPIRGSPSAQDTKNLLIDSAGPPECPQPQTD